MATKPDRRALGPRRSPAATSRAVAAFARDHRWPGRRTTPATPARAANARFKSNAASVCAWRPARCPGFPGCGPSGSASPRGRNRSATPAVCRPQAAGGLSGRAQAQQAAQIAALQFRIAGKTLAGADQIIQRPGQIAGLQQHYSARASVPVHPPASAGAASKVTSASAPCPASTGPSPVRRGSRRMAGAPATAGTAARPSPFRVRMRARQPRQGIQGHFGLVARQQPQGLGAAAAPAQQGQIIVQQGRRQRSARAFPLQQRQRRRGLPRPGLDDGRRVLGCFHSGSSAPAAANNKPAARLANNSRRVIRIGNCQHQVTSGLRNSISHSIR